jgi:type I restriction enzyme S subunit
MSRVEEETGRIDLSEVKKYGDVKKGFTKFINGDIIFAKITPCMENGKVAVVTSLLNGIGFGSTEFHVIRLKDKSLSKQFYFYYILQNWFRNLAEQNFTGTVGQRRVPTDFMKEVLVPVPPFNEQVRIVARVEELFSRLDAGVRSLQAAQTRLKQYRQATLQQAYTGKLTQKWRQDRGNHEYITEEIDIKPYRNLISWDIPHEWKWASVGNLVESMQNGIYKPIEFYSDNGVACLRMYNIEDGKIVWKDIKRMILSEEEFEKFLLKPNDILINRVNSRELVGKSAVIQNTIESSVYESKNIRMRLKNKVVSSHFVHYWMHFFSSRYFNINAQQVVGMASINQTQISNMPIPLTTLEEQQKIVETINEAYSYIDKIEGTIEKNLLIVNQFRNSVLKKAFEGKLVPQDPNDEPASVLLERIKAQRVKQRKLL